MLQCVRMFAVVLWLDGCKPNSNQAPANQHSLPEVSAGRSPSALRAPAWGDPIPVGAARVELHGSTVNVGGKSPGDLRGIAAALLTSDADTYLAEVAPLLGRLDRSGVAVWLVHPEAAVAFKVALKDERAFQWWLDQPIPGRIRVVQRSDGFEVQTGVGKLAGPDPNGPTIPLREGQLDVRRLRQSLESLRTRFQNATDACLVPSFGTELAKVATALSGFYRGPGDRIFSEICLVYPTTPSVASGNH